MQRHPNDTATPPWEGAGDENDLRYCKPELRNLVADMPADVERKLVREIGTTKELVATDNRGKSHVLNPANSDSDLETALAMRKVAWARAQLNSERHQAELTARDAAGYTCQACGAVATPSPLDRGRHTQRRQLPGGTTVLALCGTCYAVAESIAVARVGDEKIEGISRVDRIRKLIAAATS